MIHILAHLTCKLLTFQSISHKPAAKIEPNVLLMLFGQSSTFYMIFVHSQIQRDS